MAARGDTVEPIGENTSAWGRANESLLGSADRRFLGITCFTVSIAHLPSPASTAFAALNLIRSR